MFYRSNHLYEKTNSMLIGDVVLNALIQYGELRQRQGVKEYVLTMMKRKIAQLLESSNDIDNETYLSIEHRTSSWVVKPSIHTALICEVARRTVPSLITRDASGYVVSKDIEQTRVNYHSEISIIFDARASLLLEAIAECVFCGYYGSISAHERLERIIRRIVSQGNATVLNGSKGARRYVDLSSFFHERGMPTLAGAIMSGTFDFLDCSSSRIGIRFSKVAAAYLAETGVIRKLSNDTLLFLDTEVRLYEGEGFSIPSLNDKEVRFIEAVVLLSSSSTSFDVETLTSSGKPLLGMILGETYGEN